MIVEYNRPSKREEAIALLKRKTPRTVPLGGGTILSQFRLEEALAVVDLQTLGMHEISLEGGNIHLGANLRLQEAIDSPLLPDVIKGSLEKECNFNLRQSATVGGTVASGSGGSAFNALLLAMEASILWEPGGKPWKYTDYVKQIKGKEAGFISGVVLPGQAGLSLHSISRTPESEPILCICGVSLDGKTCRVVCIHAEKPMADEIYSGVLRGGKSANALAAEYLTGRKISTEYLQAALTELLQRVFEDLRKEA